MKLDHGGHLTHGMKINFSGSTTTSSPTGCGGGLILDMDELGRSPRTRAEGDPGRLVRLPEQLDFKRFREIADSVGALLVTDMATSRASWPPSSTRARCLLDVVTTTHKTLGGARPDDPLQGGRRRSTRRVPGSPGRTLMHVIAGKAVALKIAQTELFRERQRRTREAPPRWPRRCSRPASTCSPAAPTSAIARRPSRLGSRRPAGRGPPGRGGHHRQPQRRPLRSPPAGRLVGLRIGTPALATRGFQVDDFREIGKVIGEALTGDFDDEAKCRSAPGAGRALSALSAPDSARRGLTDEPALRARAGGGRARRPARAAQDRLGSIRAPPPCSAPPARASPRCCAS